MGGFGFLTAKVIPVSFHFASGDVLFGGTVCLMCSLIRQLVREILNIRTVEFLVILQFETLNVPLTSRLVITNSSKPASTMLY